MIVSGTGHRPDKLGGYSDRVLNRLIDLVTLELQELKPDRVISGVAIGFDTALAIAAIRLNIPITCAVPFAGQEKMWPPESKVRYAKILSKAEQVVIVSSGTYSATKMQVRNEYMVDRCTLLLALWNGTSGGTANCIEFATKSNKRILNLWDKWRS